MIRSHIPRNASWFVAMIMATTLAFDSFGGQVTFANPGQTATNDKIINSTNLPKIDEKRIQQLQHLLQKSMSIVEIDRALVRIAADEKELRAKQAGLQREINLQAIQIRSMREKVGIILRQYDQGIKLPFWAMLLQATKMSWQEWIQWYEYTDLMVQHDLETVQSYADAQKRLAQKQSEAKSAELALQDARHNYEIQKANVTALQKALDAELARQEDALELMKYFRQITARWLSVGLPQFRMYLGKISDAMGNIGSLINGETLSFSTEGTLFQLDDQRFNRYLREQNADLEKLHFIFDQNMLTVDGIVDDQHIYMEGNFEIVNEPANGMRWNLQRIRYMGVELPLTTVQEMQETFGFDFYPSEVGLSVKLKTIEANNHALKLLVEF